jgi:putative transposase
MQNNLHKSNRRSIRLNGYDYTRPGAYFVTICTQNKECIFGDVVNGEFHLNDYGNIIELEWMKTGNIRKNVNLDVFAIMPNHFHGIIMINDDEISRATNREISGAIHRIAPTSRTLIPNSIGSIIGQFKSITTKNIRKIGFQDFKWQRNYYEHIIRNEDNLDEIREYIANNPLKWELDRENPINAKL